MFNPSSPISGVAVTGFTAPTFTIVADTSVGNGVKQWLVTARGGTQGNDTGEVHTLNSPFTITIRRPTVLRSMSQSLATAVGLSKGPLNEFTILIRKSEKVNAVGGRVVNMAKLTLSVAPETASQAPGKDDIRGMMSLLGGLFGSATILDGLTDTVLDGSI